MSPFAYLVAFATDKSKIDHACWGSRRVILALQDTSEEIGEDRQRTIALSKRGLGNRDNG